jgi:hypothetical protein
MPLEAKDLDLLRSSYGQFIRLTLPHSEVLVGKNLGVSDSFEDVTYELIWSSHPDRLPHAPQNTLWVSRFCDITSAELADDQGHWQKVSASLQLDRPSSIPTLAQRIAAWWRFRTRRKRVGTAVALENDRWRIDAGTGWTVHIAAGPETPLTIGQQVEIVPLPVRGLWTIKSADWSVIHYRE